MMNVIVQSVKKVMLLKTARASKKVARKHNSLVQSVQIHGAVKQTKLAAQRRVNAVAQQMAVARPHAVQRVHFTQFMQTVRLFINMVAVKAQSLKTSKVRQSVAGIVIIKTRMSTLKLLQKAKLLMCSSREQTAA